MNPMLQQLDNQQGNGIWSMINTIRHADNPKAMLDSMVQQNPQMQQVMGVINQNGGDAKKAFYDMAKQKGVDPNSILSMLR